MKQYKIIAIDHNVTTLKLIQEVCDSFKDSNIALITISDPAIALDTIWNEAPHIILVGSVLPTMKGLDVVGILKKNPPTNTIPTVIISEKDCSPDEEVRAFELGAADYVRKPLHPTVLKARLKNILTQIDGRIKETEETIESGDIVLNMSTHTAYVKGKQIILTPKEFALLYLFVKKENRVLNRIFLSETVWEQEYAATSHTIDKHIANLRKKMGKEGDRIFTLPTIGYKFVSYDELAKKEKENKE